MIVPKGLKTQYNILKFNCLSKLSFNLMENPLVARYVAALVARPLLTKCYTSGVLGFFQEILANHIAGVKFKCSKDAALSARIMAACKMDGRAVKMALYGFFISAPMNHYMGLWMQKWFAGRTSLKSKIGHLCAQMFLVAPIQTLVFLVSMAFIGGARGGKEILSRVRMGYVKMLTLTWLIQPSASFVATRFVPAPLWSLFFNLVGFSVGTYFNVKIKKQAMMVQAAKKKHRRDSSSSSSSSGSSSSSSSDDEK